MDELGRLYHAARPDVPPGVDMAVLRDARAGFARRRRVWLVWRAAGATAAAAAAVVAVVLYLNRADDGARPVTDTQRVAPAGDLDGNGRVDVLDAYLLARKIDRNDGSVRGADVNGDGAVDAHDVESIAAIAVQL